MNEQQLDTYKGMARQRDAIRKLPEYEDRPRDEDRRRRMDRWDERQRFRPYRVIDGKTDWIAAAGCQEETGIVPMLLQLHEDGEYDTTDNVGVLDTGGWRRGSPGLWLINPFPPSRPIR